MSGLAQFLEARHTMMLEWEENWPACGPKGETVDAHVRLRATIHDCINLQRAANKQAGRPSTDTDECLLSTFTAVHWATVVER